MLCIDMRISFLYYTVKGKLININAVVEDFEAKLPELKKAKKIILDIRNNGGGSGKNALNIAKYFSKSDTIYDAKSYSREIIPTERAIDLFLTAHISLKRAVNKFTFF
jgi:hypothetical protein